MFYAHVKYVDKDTKEQKTLVKESRTHSGLCSQLYQVLQALSAFEHKFVEYTVVIGEPEKKGKV